MKIIIHPDNHLRCKRGESDPTFEDGISDLKDTISQMIELMWASGGIGLASTQVKSYYRMFVFENDLGDAACMINPDIVWCEGKSVMEESCLSVPGMAAKIERAAIVGVKYYDIATGKLESNQYGGREARIIQHEMDHLNGKLYFDHLSSLKRNMFLRRYAKLQKQGRIPKY